MSNQKNEKTVIDGSDNEPVVFEKIVYKLAKKWIAGSNREEAIQNAKKTNENKINVILNFLGEEIADKKIIDDTILEYTSLLHLMEQNEIVGSISVKPSQVGLILDYDTCLKNLIQLSNSVNSFNRFMWIDVEAYHLVDDTLRLYIEILKKNKNVGVVVQSYLKRSMSDIMHLLENGANIRLVKGAYDEDNSIAFTSNAEKTSNFIKLMEYIFSNSHHQEVIAIATHDNTLLNQAIELDKLYKSQGQKKNLEFQFLRGIRDDLKKSMISDGYRVGEYMPYGHKWLPYSIRRIKERKRNLLLLGRSLFDI